MCAYIYTRYNIIQTIDLLTIHSLIDIYEYTCLIVRVPQGESLWQVARITMEERFVIYIVYMTLPLPVCYNSDQDDIKSSIKAKNYN